MSSVVAPARTDFERLDWAGAQALIPRLPPSSDARELLELLRDIPESRHHHFLRLQYGYRERLVSGGKFCLPRSLRHKDGILDGFRERPVPLGLVLDNPVEVCREVEPRGSTRPLRVLKNGSLFGLFQLNGAHERQAVVSDYVLAAGLVSVHFTVPMRSDELKKALGKTRDLTWKPGAADSLLVENVLASQGWKCNILLFPDALCPNLSQAPRADDNGPIDARHPVHNLLLRVCFQQSLQQRDLAVELSLLQQQTEVNSAPEADELAAALYAIERGEMPAMVAWQPGDEDVLPIGDLLKDIGSHLTRRKTDRNSETPYWPLLMIPKHLQPGETGLASIKWAITTRVTRWPLPEIFDRTWSVVQWGQPRILGEAAEHGMVFRPFLSGTGEGMPRHLVKASRIIGLSDVIAEPPKGDVKLCPEPFFSFGIIITRRK